MDPDVKAEVALEVLRDAVLRYLAQPHEIAEPGEGGDMIPNPRKKSTLNTMESEAASLVGVHHVLGTAVERYGALVDLKRWLKDLTQIPMDAPNFVTLLDKAPLLLWKVTSALSVRDVPADIGKWIMEYRRPPTGTTEPKEG